jgi:CheY-like chemotaxis protein
MAVSRPELRAALAHLDDPVRLENHPLAQRLRAGPRTAGVSRGQALRSVLRLAIAALDPGMGEPHAELQARAFQVLYRYAVARHSMIAIADSLGISLRQAYRELDHGIAALCRVVATEFQPETEPTPGAGARPDAARRPSAPPEPERSGPPGDEVVLVDEVLQSALVSVQPLAARHDVQLSTEVQDDGIRCLTNRALLRQVMVNLLSHVIGTRGVVSVSASLYIADGERASLSIVGRPCLTDEPLEPGNPYMVAGELVERLGMALTRHLADDGHLLILLSVPLYQEHTILLVDDNEGLASLFRRYLRRQPYRVEAAANYREGMAALLSLQPDAVVLDIMLPDGDGWELLQAIRQRRGKAQPHVIVCSVIYDPLLAEALGADAYLRKPVSRVALLDALERVLSLDRSGAASPAASPRSD